MSDTISPRHADQRQSLGAYLAQGAAFIGFLLLVFAIAGFRG